MDEPRPFDDRFIACPHASLAALGPDDVVAVRTPAGRRVFVVTGDEHVRAGLLDTRLSLQRTPGRRRHTRARDLTLMNYSPADHARVRRLATPALSTRRVAARRTAVETATTASLDALGSTGRVDLLNEFARPYSFRVSCDMLGIEPAARAELYQTSIAVFTAAASGVSAPPIDSIHAVMEHEIAVRAANPAPTANEDVLTGIVAAAARAGDVTGDELVSLITMLLLAGLETTAQMICMGVVELASRPSLRARIAAEPALIGTVVEELLRMTTPGPFATARYATEDLVLGGYPIPAGGEVLMSLVAANRDTAVYDHPDELDVTRQPADRHVTFGWGPHFCPGASLARLELRLALGGLLDRFPRMTVVDGTDALRWHGNLWHRGLVALPVDLG